MKLKPPPQNAFLPRLHLLLDIHDRRSLMAPRGYADNASGTSPQLRASQGPAIESTPQSRPAAVPAAHVPAHTPQLPRSFLRDDSGQTLVLTAVCMVVLVGFLGLSIDVGQLRLQKRRLQNAVDAAALAGALEIPACAGSPNCSAVQVAAQTAVSENGLPNSSLQLNCAGGSATTLQLTVNNAPCEKSNDPNSGNPAYVEAVLSMPQPTVFARILGIGSVLLKARAEAARAPNTNCIYALDPSGSQAVQLDSAAQVTATCGLLVASTSSAALSCGSSSSLNARRIAVAGGLSTSGCSLSPTPFTGAPAPTPADPLASLPAPATPACGASTQSPFHGSSSAVTISGSATLYPDAAYCGGITISPGASVTFNPGTYVLTSTDNGAGGLTLDLGATISGSGITFFNRGPSGAITFQYAGNASGSVHLLAPGTGAYAGILFFQDPQNTSQATLLGAASLGTLLQGTFYFPSARVQFAVDSQADYMILVAQDIEFTHFTHNGATTGSSFGSDYSSLPNGSPLAGSGAVIVQ